VSAFGLEWHGQAHGGSGGVAAGGGGAAGGGSATGGGDVALGGFEPYMLTRFFDKL
jgi:hypothetical protein